jgi:hypothetical protein
MNTRALNAVAKVIDASIKNGKQTPMGWAFDLYAAGLVMSPEAAAEIAETAGQAVETAEKALVQLTAAVEESARLRARVVELEAELYTEQEQHRTTLEQRNAHAKELLALRGGRAAPYTVTSEAHAQMREGLTRYFAGQEPAPEGEHYATVHHNYRKSRDLPQWGGTP